MIFFNRKQKLLEAENITLKKQLETKELFSKSAQTIIEKQGQEIFRFKSLLEQALGNDKSTQELINLTTQINPAALEYQKTLNDIILPPGMTQEKALLCDIMTGIIQIQEFLTEEEECPKH